MKRTHPRLRWRFKKVKAQVGGTKNNRKCHYECRVALAQVLDADVEDVLNFFADYQACVEEVDAGLDEAAEVTAAVDGAAADEF